MLTIALVGKPNVGKSTLFNRIIQQNKSITANEVGVTRDRIKAKANWLNNKFTIIDTGGIGNAQIPFKENITTQVKYAINEANIILFVVEKNNINNEDIIITKMLKQYKNKKIYIVVNKCENKNDIENLNKYINLGFGNQVFLISAEHGIDVGNMLDDIFKNIKIEDYGKEGKKRLSFCIIGKTNVGKSSLMNAILNTDRVVVSEKEHTTRDSIDEDFMYDKKPYTIIDTAGIRRRGKIKTGVESFALIRTNLAIERSEIILLVIDPNNLDEQDEIIGGLCFKANIPTIIVVNKWDIMQKDSTTMSKLTKELREKFKYLSWAPIIFLSAKEKTRIHLIFENFKLIKEQLEIKVNVSQLNNILAKAQIINPPPKIKGGRLDISYATQIKSQIPTFVIFVNKPEYLHFIYARYIENQIRNYFNIKNVPITIYYKDKNARIRKD